MQADLNSEKLIGFIKKHYGIDVIDVKPLEGYANLNFWIKDANGKSFVFKSFQQSEDQSLFESEVVVLNQLNRTLAGKFPKTIQSINGDYFVEDKGNKQISTNRILTWLEGDLMCNVEHNPKIFESLGELLAS